ncbi:MAG: 5-deoxy-glucuronate isomerase [Actinomycetota bacterium]
MDDLIRRAGSQDDPNTRLSISPENAGWEYVGLRVVELTPGERREVSSAGDELAVVPLAGSCVVECDGSRFELEGRTHVFAGITDFVYCPLDSEIVIASVEGGRFALPSARAERRLEPAYGSAQDVPVEIRGAGQASRQLNNFLEPSVFDADRLMVVEVLTPDGNWSSYPPHKHDEQRPGEARLEEIYYFEVGRVGRPPGEGFGFHRTYTADASIDLTATVNHGDAALVPRGFHGPCVAAPGYDLYYLNVLAGPGEQRSMAFSDDPAYAWVRNAWSGQASDTRLPLTGVVRTDGER